MKVDDTLIGAATEKEVRVSLFQDERAVHKDVQVREHCGHRGIGLNFLKSEPGPAPDGLSRFLLDAAG